MTGTVELMTADGIREQGTLVDSQLVRRTVVETFHMPDGAVAKIYTDHGGVTAGHEWTRESFEWLED